MPAPRESSAAARRPLWLSPDGASRLVCTDHAALLATLADASVDCVWTDPPYFLSNGGTTCHSGRRVSVNKGGW